MSPESGEEFFPPGGGDQLHGSPVYRVGAPFDEALVNQLTDSATHRGGIEEGAFGELALATRAQLDQRGQQLSGGRIETGGEQAGQPGSEDVNDPAVAGELVPEGGLRGGQISGQIPGRAG